MNEKTVVSMQHRAFKRYCVHVSFGRCTLGKHPDEGTCADFNRLPVCSANNCPALRGKGE